MFYIYTLHAVFDEKDFFKKEIFNPAVEFAEEFSIKFLQSRIDQALEDADLERFKLKYDEIIDIFVDNLSEKFATDNYKPLIAIQKLLTSSGKLELSTIFFDFTLNNVKIKDSLYK